MLIIMNPFLSKIGPLVELVEFLTNFLFTVTTTIESCV